MPPLSAELISKLIKAGFVPYFDDPHKFMIRAPNPPDDLARLILVSSTYSTYEYPHSTAMIEYICRASYDRAYEVYSRKNRTGSFSHSVFKLGNSNFYN